MAARAKQINEQAPLEEPWDVGDIMITWDGQKVLLATFNMPMHERALLRRLLNFYRVKPMTVERKKR